MGQTGFNKVNNEKTISINLEFEKVCYSQGESIIGTIFLFPRLESFFQITDEPTLNIILYQKSHYSYSTGSGKNKRTVTREDIIKLVSDNLNFKNYMTQDLLNGSGFSIPFSVQIPFNAYPTIISSYSAYVAHYITVELPQVEGKRSKKIVIKQNMWPNNSEGTLLNQNIDIHKEYNKKKFLANKGTFLVNVKMPKNYFFYDEKILFEINIDISKLKDLIIDYLTINLFAKIRKNNSQNLSNCTRSNLVEINSKKIDLEKGIEQYNISDFIEFPYNFNISNVYNEIDKNGSIEVNELFEQKLYPSCINGLVSVDYQIQILLHLDSSLTFDEDIIIPIYFCLRTDNDHINQLQS